MLVAALDRLSPRFAASIKQCEFVGRQRVARGFGRKFHELIPSVQLVVLLVLPFHSLATFRRKNAVFETGF